LKNAKFEWRTAKEKNRENSGLKSEEENNSLLLDEEISQEKFSLGEIDLEVKKGELIFVMGEVGSGKSSLIEAILGNMTKISGDVKIQGNLALTTQEAWIQVKNFLPPEFQ
jgi:ATP-binding cassette subfamily C (CFTR/MRP) protein 1